ncbi:hypothetical protein L5515_014788 [Caenorhabditis briggsae]|uniref:Tyrosine-protein kinase n=1 Tax=Caenorhabditis briggsae TaxID=6238 RepID=A0AAE9J8H2_CAEBR|nr:hypothetical protein L5515_014788 [Caenorhabditis briggsae]
MKKPSKRGKNKKPHGKGRKPSKHDPRNPRSPASKERPSGRSRSSEKPSSEIPGLPQPAQIKRRRRRRDWKWKITKKEKQRGYRKQDWFWGYVSQTEAEEYLQDAVEGEFIVRCMLYQEVTKTILTVVYFVDKTRKFEHFSTNFRRNKWILESFPSAHRTLMDLVAHYHQNFIGMTQLKLKVPRKHPDWFIKRHKIICPKHAIRLGGGNFGDVVIGAYRRRLVAVKTLHADGDRFLVERDNLMKEASIMKKLEHPYITKIIGVSIDEPSPMLLVEIMACDLTSHIVDRGEKTTLGEKLLYCWQIASGMDFMTQREMVHRDIASRNALFSRYGILKLADFGLSEFIVNLTAVNIGRDHLPVRWYAPEAIQTTTRPATFNEKSEVWSYGVTCNEIFKNGAAPIILKDHHEKAGKKECQVIAAYKDGDDLHVLPKTLPADVQTFFKRLWLRNPADRPNFKEILATLDQWIKVTYPPPPIEMQMVQKINHCTPITIAEYELLYKNNWDWCPPARKVRIKKNKNREKTGSIRSKGEPKKKTDEEVLKKLKKKLVKRRKMIRLREKLKWWREKRREEKRKAKELISFQRKYLSTKVRRTIGYKKTRDKYEKMVELYAKLMKIRWRKRRSNRQSRFRLRRHRLINKKSKHPVSRNRKTKVVAKKKDEKKRVRVKYVVPTIPKTPKFVTKKRKKSVSGASKDVVVTPKKGTPIKPEPGTMDILKEKRLRNIRRKRRHQLRKWNKRKHRKKRRVKRRQRRRQKLRRRYRRKKMAVRRLALNVDQKERMRVLKKRRRRKRAVENRLKRGARIGKILREWRDLRRLVAIRKKKRERKRKAIQLEKNEKKAGKQVPQEKAARSGRKRSGRKQRT